MERSSEKKRGEMMTTERQRRVMNGWENGKQLPLVAAGGNKLSASGGEMERS